MFCTNCKQARVENETPCPYCGAPSPLLQLSGVGQWGTNSSAGGQTMSSFGLRKTLQMNSWGGPVANEMSPQAADAGWGQASIDQPTQQQSPLSQSTSAWPDNGTERAPTSQALLPVVYQEPQANDIRQSTVALQLIPQNAIEHLLPEIVEVPDPLYVPPLYTNPRPLIPRYRIISGSLSVLIIALLLCGGVGYYAQSSGILGSVVRMFTNQSPPSVQVPSAQRLPDPPDKIDTGDALAIIPSGTTTLRIDGNNLPVETDKVFTVNQPFYVTYTVQPPSGEQGQVSVKWYMNGKLYSVVTSALINDGKVHNGSQQMQYLVPAEGSVEIYWNDRFAQRFYFVVQPVG